VGALARGHCSQTHQRWLGTTRARRGATHGARARPPHGLGRAREKEEIDRFEASVRDELVMLDRALAAH
jgi:hypothetical protein